MKVQKVAKDDHEMNNTWTVSAALLLIAGGGLAIGSSATSASQSIENVVMNRSRAFAQAALSIDFASFAAFMADDYIMLWPEPAADGKESHWATKTKQEWVEELRSKKNRYRSVQLMHMKVYLHGSVATVTGDYTQVETQEGIDHSEAGLFTETWVNRSGRWVIVGSVFP
jgi:ketosteroid isomerase-like protein